MRLPLLLPCLFLGFLLPLRAGNLLPPPSPYPADVPLDIFIDSHAPPGTDDVVLAAVRNLPPSPVAGNISTQNLRLWPGIMVDRLSNENYFNRSVASDEFQGWDYLVESAGQVFVRVRIGADERGDHPRFVSADYQFGPLVDAVAALRHLGAGHPGSHSLTLLYALALPPPYQNGVPLLWLKDGPGTAENLFYPLVDIPGILPSHRLYTLDELYSALDLLVLSQKIVVLDPRQTWSSPGEMNDYFVDRFIKSAGFGITRVMQPDMSLNPFMRLGMSAPPPGTIYNLDRLELIGVAMHKTPVAFTVRRHAAALPNDQSRPLTGFEQSALLQFAAGSDALTQTDSSGNLTVVGPIRARQECLECHGTYHTGDVLGAFTYRLHPAVPLPPSIGVAQK